MFRTVRSNLHKVGNSDQKGDEAYDQCDQFFAFENTQSELFFGVHQSCVDNFHHCELQI